MSDELLSRAEGPTHRLTIHRPARRNALTPAVARELAGELDRIGDASEARVVLLEGAGGHFCAGLDLHWLRSLVPPPSVSDVQHGLADFQATVLAIVRCPVPVIAVLRGAVAGFGLDLALACDMRIAGAGTTFTSAYARLGLLPDGGSTFTLPRLVSAGRALRLLMSGETIDAVAALEIGLVDEVAADAALGTAEQRLVQALLAGAPASIRTIKRLCRAAELGALEQALSSEGAAQLQALQSPEFQRRLEAFLARGAAESGKAAAAPGPDAVGARP